MTQEQAAVRARIARHSIQRYETGFREPSASALKSLADVYGKNLDWFWGDQEENSDPQESQLPTQDGRETRPNAAQIALQEVQSDLSDEAIKFITNCIRFVHTRKAHTQDASPSSPLPSSSLTQGACPLTQQSGGPNGKENAHPGKTGSPEKKGNPANNPGSPGEPPGPTRTWPKPPPSTWESPAGPSTNGAVNWA